MPKQFFPVVAIDELAEGACRAFEVAGRPVLVARLGDGPRAIENRCSHLDSPLSTTRLYRGGQVACPIHGARFDLRTGAAKSPPAFLPIAVYETRIRDGRIEIALDSD